MSSRSPIVGCLPMGLMGPADPDITKTHAARLGRVCAYTTCTTKLSRYNIGDYCGIHEHHEAWRVLPNGDLRPREANDE